MRARRKKRVQLTEAQRAQMRAAYRADMGATYASMAAMYNVSFATASRIIGGYSRLEEYAKRRKAPAR